MSTQKLCFRAEIIKIIKIKDKVYPCKLQFYYIKVEFKCLCVCRGGGGGGFRHVFVRYYPTLDIYDSYLEQTRKPSPWKVLRHRSHNKGLKQSWKNSHLMWESTRSVWIKFRHSNHWAKESTPWRSCQRLNIWLQAMRNLPRQIVKCRSATP